MEHKKKLLALGSGGKSASFSDHVKTFFSKEKTKETSALTITNGGEKEIERTPFPPWQSLWLSSVP